MYEYLLDLFLNGRIDEINLDIAVKKRWITEIEKQQLIQSKNQEQ
jgi:hypothetical protein